jgi:hypothetical protein
MEHLLYKQMPTKNSFARLFLTVAVRVDDLESSEFFASATVGSRPGTQTEQLSARLALIYLDQAAIRSQRWCKPPTWGIATIEPVLTG